MNETMPSLTTAILIEIRDELRSTREELSSRIDATNSKLDTTNSRLDTTNSRLDLVAKRQIESEVRISTELVAVRDSIDRVVDLYRTDRALRGDVSDLKHRVAELERKTG